MNAKVDDVRERAIKLEAREYERQIEVLNDRLSAAFKRIDDLEGTRDQQKGAKALVDCLRQTAPRLLAGVAPFVAGIGIKNRAEA